MVPPAPAAVDPRPADPAGNDPHAAAQALVERQLHMLTRLAEMGMRIAEATERWAVAAAEAAEDPHAAGARPPAGQRGDPGLVFSRVARAVRLTLMLQTRLLKELPDLGRAGALAKMLQGEARRTRAHRLVDQVIRAEHDADPEAAEQLSDEARERLRDEDLTDDLAGRSVAELVGRICRDLGLSADWTAWAIATAAPEPPPADQARPLLWRAGAGRVASEQPPPGCAGLTARGPPGVIGP